MLRLTIGIAIRLGNPLLLDRGGTCSMILYKTIDQLASLICQPTGVARFCNAKELSILMGFQGLTSSRTCIQQNTPSSVDDRVSYKKVAATYSPTWWGSTIGDGELNFSVRNGKRWILTAITATVCFWEKTTSEVEACSNNFISASIYVSLSFRLILIDLTPVPCFNAVGTQGNPTQRKMSGY